MIRDYVGARQDKSQLFSFFFLLVVMLLLFLLLLLLVLILGDPSRWFVGTFTVLIGAAGTHGEA